MPQPHNLYLAVWLEAGLIGLLGFFLLIAAWFRNLVSLRHPDDGNERIKKTSALLMGLLGLYLALGLVDTPFFKTDLAFIFWLILAFGIGLSRQDRRSDAAMPRNLCDRGDESSDR